MYAQLYVFIYLQLYGVRAILHIHVGEFCACDCKWMKICVYSHGDMIYFSIAYFTKWKYVTQVLTWKQIYRHKKCVHTYLFSNKCIDIYRRYFLQPATHPIYINISFEIILNYFKFNKSPNYYSFTNMKRLTFKALLFPEPFFLINKEIIMSSFFFGHTSLFFRKNL